MIKNILAVAVVLALGACSSGSGSGDSNAVNDDSQQGGNADQGNTDQGNTDQGNTDTGNGNTGGETDNQGGSNAPVGGGAGPVTATKSGSYTGNFGGSNGVFIINNDFDLAGLAINANGSAQSLFGNLGSGDTFSGGLRQFIHQESTPDGATGSFGAVASRGGDLNIDVTIVNGQTIESTAESATAVTLVGTTGSAVAPANAQSLAGTWAGVHSFCGADTTACQLLTTTLTFSGTSVTGSTAITAVDGTVGAPVLIEGGITDFGDGALIDFNWGDSAGYSGVVFFTPAADGRLVFVGENQANADVPTISAVMNRQ